MKTIILNRNSISLKEVNCIPGYVSAVVKENTIHVVVRV